MRDLLRSGEYPALSALIALIDHYLSERHPRFFGGAPIHPVLPLKRSKVIHDNLWGTNTFSWQELAVIDSPILQRLRGIHQTGLAYHVYPSAHHTRFEHSLGVATVASRIFDSLLQRQRGKFRDAVKASTPSASTEGALQDAILQLRLELRLAALLHDTGHSLFSHSSEQVFENLKDVKAASDELARIVGKRKGAGETLAFAIAMSQSVQQLLDRARDNLLPKAEPGEYTGQIDLTNVALMIVGRTRHPFLQFLADIITSGFDADKLDYLLRDATSAGLPLRYDFDRYFYSVLIEDDHIADGDKELQRLYSKCCPQEPARQAANRDVAFEYYETNRLRLPAKAMNTIEQIVICKLMLFSYIYHHPKVRAAEGALIDLLNFAVDQWRKQGEADDAIVVRFLDTVDASLNYPEHLTAGMDEESKAHIEASFYRLRNRLLPREVFRLGGAVATGPQRALLTDFLTSLQDKSKRNQKISEMMTRIATILHETDRSLGKSPEEVIRRVGLRFDVPKAPIFEDVDELVIRGQHGVADMQLLQVFPIGQWTHAYTHYRYYVRIFCFSEYLEPVRVASQNAMKEIIGIEADDFYEKILRRR